MTAALMSDPTWAMSRPYPGALVTWFEVCATYLASAGTRDDEDEPL